MQNKHDTSNTIFLDRFLASCDTFLMEVTQVTKQKAIKELLKLGWVLVDARKGQSSAEFLSPATSQWPNQRVVANAQDLLAEVEAKESTI